MPSYYESLGFKRSPFFREALEPVKEDFEAFTGRVDDVRKFLSVLNPEAGVHLISGKRGVGKTSFVNAIQYLTSLDGDSIKKLNARFGIHYYPERMLPNYRKIQLEEDDNVDKVLLKVISSIIFSVDQFVRINKIDFDPIANERSTFQRMMGSTILKAEENVDANSKYALLDSLISSIKSNLSRNGIYLVIDNLDIVDINIATRVLNELRDFLFVSGLCVIMMGQEGIYTDLRATEDGLRVIDRITGQENLLNPMSIDETIQILEIRKKNLASDPSRECEIPIDLGYVRELYNITGGQIRLLFKLCESICMAVLSQYPSIKKISREDASSYLKTIVLNETRITSYSKKDIEFLKACLEKPMRPKDYKNLKLDSGMHFIRVANKLIKDELITKESDPEDGVAVYYAPTGLLRLCRHVELI